MVKRGEKIDYPPPPWRFVISIALFYFFAILWQVWHSFVLSIPHIDSHKLPLFTHFSIFQAVTITSLFRFLFSAFAASHLRALIFGSCFYCVILIFRHTHTLQHIELNIISLLRCTLCAIIAMIGVLTMRHGNLEHIQKKRNETYAHFLFQTIAKAHL